VRDGRIVGAEALARLHDPKLGFIPPDEFIRVAERTGDIMEVGRQIVTRVCEFLSSARPEQLGIQRISINLSPAQCMNEELVEEMSEIAERYGVSMRMFDFEITESSMDDLGILKKQLLRLQSSGAELSLDDFGTGTSNLTRLMELPIHVVKLDMDIVFSFFSGRAKLLPDLVRMFQNASMQIVVEGVETAEMKAVLAEMGCDYEQGYFFSKPVPAQEFIEYIQTQD
jgi:EAL domain-containing protein (putative c-di-GMP-specific phosphodiesterase class I)